MFARSWSTEVLLVLALGSLLGGTAWSRSLGGLNLLESRLDCLDCVHAWADE